VYQFDGMEGGLIEEVCGGGGDGLTLYSSVAWDSLQTGNFLYVDNELKFIWKNSSQYFWNQYENQYLEINTGDGKITIEPTAC
jgi:hypothetical protein